MKAHTRDSDFLALSMACWWVVTGSTPFAQTYPTKPVRILTAEVGSEIAMKAAPDGYTLLCYGAPMWLSPFLRARVPWDPSDGLPILVPVRSHCARTYAGAHYQQTQSGNRAYVATRGYRKLMGKHPYFIYKYLILLHFL